MSQSSINMLLALAAIVCPAGLFLMGLAVKYICSINVTLGSINLKLGIMGEKQEQHEQRMDRIDDHLDAVDKRVLKVETHCAAVIGEE